MVKVKELSLCDLPVTFCIFTLLFGVGLNDLAYPLVFLGLNRLRRSYHSISAFCIEHCSLSDTSDVYTSDYDVGFSDVVLFLVVPAGSPSRGGDLAVYVFDINQPSLPTPCFSVLVSISAFMALSTVFHSINSADNSPLSHSVLQVLLLPY